MMEFKRFSKDKQEQIKQFVAYAQMMGLTGKDIRCIGDKLDRMRKAEERNANMAAIKTLECIPIGDDRRHKGEYLQQQMDYRFKLKTDSGTYKFLGHYNDWNITSMGTKQTIKYQTKFDGQLTETRTWSRRARWCLLMDIYNGTLKLNF